MDFIDTGSEKIYSHNLLKKDCMERFLNLANNFDEEHILYHYFLTMEKAIKYFCEKSFENLDSYREAINIIDIDSLTKVITTHITLSIINNESKLKAMDITKEELLDALFNYLDFRARDKRLFEELNDFYLTPNKKVSIKYKSKLINEFTKKVFRKEDCTTQDKINLNENLKAMTQKYFDLIQASSS